MKALVLHKYASTRDLRIEETPRPSPKANEVLVRTCAASVNDWDWAMVRGSPFYIRLLCGLVRPKIGVPGVDVSGVIEAVGEGVSKFKIGDRVYGDLSDSGFGAFAEYVATDEAALTRMPDNMTFTAAAALPHAAMLAVQGLCDYGQIGPGMKLLFNGAGGGVGTLGVQIARHKGVLDITGVDSAEKSKDMIAAGFDKTIDYKTQNFTKSGQRYDYILDARTGFSVFAYLRALNPGGSYVTVGGSTGKLLQAFLLGLIVRNFTSKKISVLALKPNKDMAYLNELWDLGVIKPVIDGPFLFDDLPQALQRFGEGHHKGKVVVTMDLGH